MRSTLLAMSATVLLGFFAPTVQCSPQPVTVLLQFDHPGWDASSRTMQQEVQILLGRSLDLHFKTVEDGRSEQGRLVVFRMHGICNMNGPVGEHRSGIALGSTYVSDGAVLPFGQVECDRLRASVQRVFGLQHPTQHERQLGLAMGRVLAHELYHMLAGSTEHTEHGVTKSGLTPFELVANQATLPANAETAIGNGGSRLPDVPSSAGGR